MPWFVADIVEAVAAAFADEDQRLREEAAVYGMDARDELALHPLIAKGLNDAGFGVYHEQRYPADRPRRKRSEGERCDIVLTPDALPLKQPDVAGTLFDDANAVALDNAFWLEVKVVHQHTDEGPNPRYSAQLLSAVRQDVSKLCKDWDILHAGLLIVMFTANADVATHDLNVWQDRCLAKGLPIAAPSRRDVVLTDRCGNSNVTLVVYPVRHV